MTEEIEVAVCCDALLDVLEKELFVVAQTEAGHYCEVLPEPGGEGGIAINFCPFCGEPRPGMRDLIAGETESVTADGEPEARH